MFKMSHTTTTPLASWYGLIRFRSNQDAAKLKSIRAMAYMALVNGNEVHVHVYTTFNNSQGQDDCS